MKMGSGGIDLPFLTPVLDRDEWSISCPGRFNSYEIGLGTHRIAINQDID
jgi:hypothetical protein